MSEENEYKIFGETRGHYLITKTDNRFFQVFFPVDATVDENIEVFQFLLDRLVKAKEEKEKKENSKE